MALCHTALGCLNRIYQHARAGSLGESADSPRASANQLLVVECPALFKAIFHFLGYLHSCKVQEVTRPFLAALSITIKRGCCGRQSIRDSFLEVSRASCGCCRQLFLFLFLLCDRISVYNRRPQK